MIAILIIIIGHICYGTTNVLWKNPRNELGTLPLIIIRSFASFLIFLFSYFVLTSLQFIPRNTFNLLDILQTVAICAVNFFGLFFFLKSMKHAPVSNTIGFGKIGLILGIAIGYFVYNEEISVLKIILCVVVVIGVSLIEIYSPNRTSTVSKGLVYTILAKVFWSTSYLFVPFIIKLGPILFCAILELTVFSLSSILFVFKPTKINFKEITIKTRNEVGLLVILGTAGTFCLNFALANISIILFAIIGLIEPIIGLLISKIYHKEYITKFQKIGIALGIIAAFVLSVTK